MFSMLCKMMKHLEVIYWRNRERHVVDSDCHFTGVMMFWCAISGDGFD